MPISPAPIGTPGISTSGLINFPNPLVDGVCSYRPGGGKINGTKTRDIGNSADGSTNLRVGLSMAYSASDGKWSNWSKGTLQSAYNGTGTSLSVTAATATEIIRSMGASGTLVLTGPNVASGTVRQITATYSAVGATSITITALGANQVQTLTFNAAATAGTYAFRIPRTDGTFVTATAAWNGTNATLLANIQAALDAATGVANGIVVSGASAATTMVFTFSGTGYANLPWPVVEIDGYPTTPVSYTNTLVTGVDGRFIAGAVISDPSYTLPLSFIKTANKYIPDSGDLDWNNIPDGGRVDVTQLLDYPTDSSFKTWFKAAMRNANGNMPYSFSDF